MSPVHQEAFFIRKGKQTLPTVELLRRSFSWETRRLRVLLGTGCQCSYLHDDIRLKTM